MAIIRHAAAVDLDALASTLASAFAEDPMWNWLFDSAENRDSAGGLRNFFAITLKAGLSRGHVYTNADRSAAAIWAPPDVGSLGRPDGEALATAYLESSNPRNLSFYRRHGFVATGDIELENGPTMTSMWRESRREI